MTSDFKPNTVLNVWCSTLLTTRFGSKYKSAKSCKAGYSVRLKPASSLTGGFPKKEIFAVLLAIT